MKMAMATVQPDFIFLAVIAMMLMQVSTLLPLIHQTMGLIRIVMG